MRWSSRCFAVSIWAVAVAAVLPPLSARAEDEEERVAKAIKKAVEGSDPEHKLKDITWTEWRADTKLEGDWLLQTPGKAVWGQADFVGSNPSCTDGPSCDPSLHLLRCTPGGTECQASKSTCRQMASSVSIPGVPPASLCAGPADAMLDEIYKLIINAKAAVDIASLSAPDGRFRDMLRNAMTYLARSNRAVTVRILIADYAGSRPNKDFSHVDVTQLLTDLVTDANNSPDETNKLTVFAGRARMFTPTLMVGWPHMKIVAVDGRMAMVGGENLWTDTYLSWTPVWDLNVRFEGQAAGDATNFLNQSWKYLCEHRHYQGHVNRRYVRSYSYAPNKPGTPLHLQYDCAPGLSLGKYKADGDVRVMGVGKLGALNGKGDQSVIAQEALIRAARDGVYLSQQNLQGPVFMDYQDRIMKALADQIVAQRDVFLVQSGDGAQKGSTEKYSNGTLAEMAVRMRMYVQLAPGAPSDSTKRNELLCRRFHLAPIRFNATSATYAGTNPPQTIPNHAKFIMADKTAFYVGSHNLYPSGNNMEYGVIVDDIGLTKRVHEDYWDQLWNYAKLSAISGGDAPNCIYLSSSEEDLKASTR